MYPPSIKCIPLHGDIIFTPEIRRLLREKRLSLHLGYVPLGAILKIHWTTVRNWEQGNVVHCQRRHLRRLKEFILGQLDDEIAASLLSPTKKKEKGNRLTHNILFYYQQIHLEYLYRLSHSPQHQTNAFLKELNSTILKE